MAPLRPFSAKGGVPSAVYPVLLRMFTLAVGGQQTDSGRQRQPNVQPGLGAAVARWRNGAATCFFE